MPATTTRYSAFAKLLHWTVAVMVIGLIVVGLMLGSLPQGPVQNTAYDLHKSAGFLLLILMVVRLANRVIAGAPPHEPTLERWQVIASNAVHHLLYVLLFVQPLLGWFANSAFGAPINFFWLFDIPPLIGKNEELADMLFEAHERVGYAIAILAAIHIAAALQHYFIRKDGVLQRMLPEAGN